MTQHHKRQANKRLAKRYWLHHQQIYTLAAIAFGVLVVLVMA